MRDSCGTDFFYNWNKTEGNIQANAGKVYRVGAGPGDRELLTLKAVRALACANVVMIDDLVDRRVLEHSPAARAAALGSPARIMIGEVVKLAHALERTAFQLRTA